MTTNRIDMLAQFLAENPTDAFARYGLAMEYAKTGKIDNAMEHFNKLLALHPDYAAGYFMAAQTLSKSGRSGEAKKFLQDGIGAAARTGNAHAKGEMEAMLAELGE